MRINLFLIVLVLSNTANAGICDLLKDVFFPKKMLSPYTEIKHPPLKGAWISHISGLIGTYKNTWMRQSELNKLLRVESLVAGGEPRLSEKDAINYVKALKESIKEAEEATPFGPVDTVGSAGKDLMESLDIATLESENKYAAIRTAEILYQLDRFYGNFNDQVLPHNLRSPDGENLNLRRLAWYYQFKSEDN